MAESDIDIIRDYDDCYDESMEQWSPYYDEAYKDLSCFLGNQWSDEDKQYLRDQGRNAYVFNKIHRVIKSLTGYQRRNRLSSLCEPIENSDERTAELFTDCLLWVLQRNNGYNCISKAFSGACVTGINLLSLTMDYSNDRESGDISIGVEPFNTMVIDPYFTDQSLKDCRYVIKRRYATKEQAKMLLPDMADDIDDVSSINDDNKFPFSPRARNSSGSSDEVAIDEFWRQTTVKRKMLVDRVTGETRMWKGSTASLKEFKQQFPWVIDQDIWEPSVQLDIIVNRVPMYSGEDPWGLGSYPFVPVIAYWEPEYDDAAYKLQGVVRLCRDAQEEYNKRRSKIADILDSQINSGWIVRKGAVTNTSDLYRTGQGVVIEREIDSRPEDVVRTPPAEAPQSLFMLEQILNKDIFELVGLNDEVLGTADQGNTEISGTLAKMRAYNGMTTTQDLFDNLSMSQKILSEKIVKLIQSNWSPEKVQRLTNKEVTEEFYNNDFGKYDCVVREGMLTDTQRAMAYAQAMQALQAGINIPHRYLVSKIPIGDKAELMQAYDEEAQMQAEQQKRIQEQDDLLKRMQEAKIVSDLSLAAERRSRMVADTGLARERVAAAGLDRAKTLTEVSKAGAEMEKMQTDTALKQIAGIQQLLDIERDKEKRDVQEAGMQALQEVLATSQIVGTTQEQPQQQMQQPGAL